MSMLSNTNRADCAAEVLAFNNKYRSRNFNLVLELRFDKIFGNVGRNIDSSYY